MRYRRGTYTEVPFEELFGKTLTKIVIMKIYDEDEDSITFETTDGETYAMYHEQDCCESVTIEEIIGDLNDLIGSPIQLAEEVENEGGTEWGSYTWTFYKLATVTGAVTIRWYGESNGYYSEAVSFIKLKEEAN